MCSALRFCFGVYADLSRRIKEFVRSPILHRSCRFGRSLRPKGLQQPRMSILKGREERIAELRQKQKALPTRVPVSQAQPGEVVKLSIERKHLTNILKMVAYQAESDLLALVRPAYARADDKGRTLIQCALTSEAELRVEITMLHVTLTPLSSPHRTRAIGILCEALNTMKAKFPGTNLRLCYVVRKAS